MPATHPGGLPKHAEVRPGGLTSRDLVYRALSGQSVPRTPAGPLGVHFCARLAGATLRQYTTQARVLAESVLRYYERYRPDAIWISADTWVTAEAMGARVGAATDEQPFGGVGPPLIQRPGDIDRIPAPDPGCQGRHPLMIEALARVVHQLGKEVFIVACFDQFPFSLAAALAGVNELMVKVIGDPPFVVALMERCLEYGIRYGQALGQAGADLLSGGDAPAGLVGPRAYRQLALPFERRLIERLKTVTSKRLSLHICGRVAPILADMVGAGADVLEIDHFVELKRACQIVGPKVALWGNLDPVSLLAQAKPAEVRRAAQAAIAAVRACGHTRFVLSSGCALAVETPPENLEAMLRCERQSDENTAS